MKEVNFKVQENDLDTVITILQNLKSGLIHELEVQGSAVSRKTHYKPTTNKVIKEVVNILIPMPTEKNFSKKNNLAVLPEAFYSNSIIRIIAEKKSLLHISSSFSS